MKRLIKKSEIYDAFEKSDIYHEVFKNPTSSEIEAIRKEFDHKVRGIIYDDGTVYIWSGYILHDDINKYLSDKIDVDQFRFAFFGEWEFNLHHKYELKDVKEKIDANLSLFKSAGDLNETMYIGPDKNNQFFDLKNYDDLIEEVEKLKIS